MNGIRSVYGKRPGGFFHKNKALLVLDSMRAHITDSVKEAIEDKLNSSCDSWGRNKVFAATRHLCKSCI